MLLREGRLEKGYISEDTNLDAAERGNTHVEEDSIQNRHRNELQAENKAYTLVFKATVVTLHNFTGGADVA